MEYLTLLALSLHLIVAPYCNTYGNYRTVVLQIVWSLQWTTIAILYRGGPFISPPEFILNAIC
jgi:hypothetical protein